MILLLQAAALISALLRDWPSTAIIAAVVVFNTSAGVLQQGRADRVMAELAALVAPTSLVRRDGLLVTVPASRLVSGDEVVVSGGDLVPADVALIEAHDLEVDEAPVTGESLPVVRAAGEELLAGTRVTGGRAVGTVVRTGADTGLGRIATLLASAQARPTPLQRRLTRLSRGLVVLVVVLTVVVVGLGVAQGRSWGEMVLVGLSLTVAAVPESLPAVVTVALAVGAHRMAQRHVVVRSLPAVETLGSVTVVATDKTGTLTEGRLAVHTLWVGGERLRVGRTAQGAVLAVEASGAETAGGDPALRRLLEDVVLCNDAELAPDDAGGRVVAGNALDGALLELVVATGVSVPDTRRAWARTSEVPFAHATRTMTTWHRGAGGAARGVCKGAPEAVLDLVTDRSPDVVAALGEAEALAAAGLRVIAVADCEEDGAWRLVGLVAVGDPPRASAAGVVQRLRQAGIRLVLVTGDHAGTAAAIAREVGIATATDVAVEGSMLDEVAPSHRRDLTVVARVVPAQKVHVVEWLQGAGEVVAMLGDGVNDAPALRCADIGVAAGSGSEVAKEASDLVLTDDELASVVAAVEEGRRIFANIRAFLLYAVSGGLAEVGVMVAGAMVGLPLPLLPGQILWINLLTHGLVGVAFGSEPLDPHVMAQPPRPPSESVFTRVALLRLAAVTFVLVGTSLVVAALTEGADDVRRTALFLALGGGQLGVALALRARGRRGGWRARGVELSVLVAGLLLVAAVWAPGLQSLLHTQPLPAPAVALAVLAALVPGSMLRLWLTTADRASPGPSPSGISPGPAPPAGPEA